MINLTVGQLLGPLEIDASRDTARAYAAASGDDNPIHTDDAAARALGLPGVIAHGMWTMAAALRVVTTTLGPGAVRAASCRFGRPLVLPESGSVPLRVLGTVSAVDGDTATVQIEARALIGETDERIAKLEVTVA